MTKARAKASAPEKPVVEELKFRSENAYLCLLVNRRNKLIRVIDFRAGALPAKRLFIQSVAKQEEIEKIITLVEKDEVSLVDARRLRARGHDPRLLQAQRRPPLRLRHRREDRVGRGQRRRAASGREDDQRGQEERSKDVPEKIKGATADESRRRDGARAAATPRIAQGRAVRAPSTPSVATPRASTSRSRMKGAKDNFISAEYQDCFGHALIEILHRPDDDKDVLARRTASASSARTSRSAASSRRSRSRAVDDMPLATVFTAAGYRKTGLLALRRPARRASARTRSSGRASSPTRAATKSRSEPADGRGRRSLSAALGASVRGLRDRSRPLARARPRTGLSTSSSKIAQASSCSAPR